MPELPEVETMVRDLRPRLIGQKVAGIEAAFEGIVTWPSFEEFQHRLLSRTITAVSRRGKYALFSLNSDDVLTVHRGMTGSLLWRHPDDAMESHVRLLLRMDVGAELRFNDPRKFGKIQLMQASGEERPLPWVAMGPEPLDGDFSPALLRRQLLGRTGLIKPLLLNQRLVAGLGNIYVDEALFRARIHPTRRANSLRATEVGRLHRAILDVLTAAVEGRGTTFSNYTDIEGRAGAFQGALQVFQRTGGACLNCSTPIARLVVGGRGTHVCPRCQKVRR